MFFSNVGTLKRMQSQIYVHKGGIVKVATMRAIEDPGELSGIPLFLAKQNVPLEIAQ